MANAGSSGIVKDVTEVYSSLFDHTPIIHKEVEFFVKEFEETRKDREVDRLFKILERVTELKGSELQTTISLGDIHLPRLAVDLQVAESIASKLIQKRATSDSETLAKLEKRREDRVVEWDTFVHDMTAKCVKIDNSFAIKQEEIREAFRKTEEQIFSKKAEQSAADK